MKKTLLTLCLAVGSIALSHADNNINNSNYDNNIVTNEQTECTLTVTCADGSTVSATASSCEIAGRMVDSGCQ